MPRAKRRRAAPKRATVGRCLGYVRVSTDRQGLSIERQGHAINAEAVRRGCRACVYSDNGASGTLPPERRPQLRAALEELEGGRADALIVAKLDRLGRNAADLTAIVERAQQQGWALVVLDPPLDLDTAAGRMVAAILGAVAELEAEMVAERTAAVVAMKREQGKSLGGRRSTLPAEVRERIRARRAAGATLAAIAGELNAGGVPTGQGGTTWRPSSVAAVLNQQGRSPTWTRIAEATRSPDWLVNVPTKGGRTVTKRIADCTPEELQAAADAYGQGPRRRPK